MYVLYVCVVKMYYIIRRLTYSHSFCDEGRLDKQDESIGGYIFFWSSIVVRVNTSLVSSITSIIDENKIAFSLSVPEK